MGPMKIETDQLEFVRQRHRIRCTPFSEVQLPKDAISTLVLTIVAQTSQKSEMRNVRPNRAKNKGCCAQRESTRYCVVDSFTCNGHFQIDAVGC